MSIVDLRAAVERVADEAHALRLSHDRLLSELRRVEAEVAAADAALRAAREDSKRLDWLEAHGWHLEVGNRPRRQCWGVDTASPTATLREAIDAAREAE